MTDSDRRSHVDLARAVFDHRGLGVAITDAEGRFIEVNGAFTELLGYESAELAGRPFIEVTHPEDRDPNRELFESMRSGKLQRFDFDKRYLHKDGREVPVRVSVSPLCDAQGRYEATVAVVIDVTEQRESERLLRLSEERFRLLARATSDAVWDWDLVTDELWWGDGFENLFGFSRAHVEPTIASWTSRIHPDDIERAYVDVKAAIEGGRDTWVGHYRFRRADGTYAFVEDRGHVIRGEGGKPLRMIGGMTDQSEQREAASRLAQQAALLDEVSDAIMVLDAELTITSWSRGAERLFGLIAGDLVGRSVVEVLALDPMVVGAARARIAAHGEWSAEVAIATGRVRVTTLARWRSLERLGEPDAILAIHTDLTQQKLLEAQSLRAQRIESIGTLAGGIAHDLNNVLAPILMAIDYLRSEETDPDRADTLATIERSAERGADMVRQLLTFARGIDGRREPVDVKRLMAEVVRILDETLLKSVTVSTSIPERLPWIVGDATQLHQVLLNLCINARDAMPQGGLIRISAESTRIDQTFAQQLFGAREGLFLVLSVEDSGIGMSAEIIDRIFDPFYTTKEVGRGTGLGLSTSLAIIKNHGGFIRVMSEPGRGSRFSVYLPIEEGEYEAQTEERVELPRGSGQLLLVVDDEATVRSVTQRTLERFGYRVVLASDGADAVATFVKHKQELALVITDLMMLVMDGSAFVTVLRKLAPELPVIAVTGVQGGTSMQRVEGLGVHRVLSKPYTARTLLEAISEALRG